ncbi:MAG: GxGYxYP domain-containing protein, partial [Polyangiaceae bacterium]
MRYTRNVRTTLLFAASFAALLYPRAAHATGSLNVADVSSLQNFGYGSSTIADRRLAYDRLVALTSIQGIVNRTSPELYLVFNQPIDELWLTRLQGAEMGGGLLTGRTVQRLNKAVSQTATVAAQISEVDVAIDSLLKTYSSQLKGLAVWDENVPSTLNAAFTAAGVDDLIVVRFDKDPASLYQKLLAKGFTAKVSLVNADGSSLFVNGITSVPGLTSGLSHKSSGRAKADAYLWASETYLKTKKTNPTEFGMMVDGIWVKDPLYANNGGASPLNLWYVTNHDWLVAERGFPFDFNPLSTTVASDDPGAPAGLDLTVQNEILLNARALAGSEVISIRGFIPWPYKYQTGGNPVDLEWASVKNISPFAAGLDADAY